MARKWMQGVKQEMERRGTVGAFAAQAKRAGMGVLEYARKVLKQGSRASTKTKRRASLARTFARYRRG